MRQRDRIEVRESARPKIWRDNLLADIEARAAAAWCSTTIDEQGPALGRDQQYRVALGNVDGRLLQFASPAFRLATVAQGKIRHRQPRDRTTNKESAPPRREKT